MLDTSKDVLNFSIAIAVIGLAGFSAWAIYYFARILQQVFKVAREMRDRLHKLDELIKTIKEKIEHSTSYLLLISEGMLKLVDLVKDKVLKPKEEKDGGKKKKK